MSLSTIIQLYRGGQFYWGRKRRKPPTCSKQLTNFIRWYYIEYTSPWAGFKLIALDVIFTDWIYSCKSNCHTITTMTTPKWFRIKSTTFVFRQCDANTYLHLYVSFTMLNTINWLQYNNSNLLHIQKASRYQSDHTKP